jgi:hypothetical protein
LICISIGNGMKEGLKEEWKGSHFKSGKGTGAKEALL